MLVPVLARSKCGIPLPRRNKGEAVDGCYVLRRSRIPPANTLDRWAAGMAGKLDGSHNGLGIGGICYFSAWIDAGGRKFVKLTMDESSEALSKLRLKHMEWMVNGRSG